LNNHDAWLFDNNNKKKKKEKGEIFFLFKHIFITTLL